MSDIKFKIGDCVELKHNGGNLKMTVNHLKTHGNEILITCIYLNKEGKFETVDIFQDALKACETTS
jgi:uncharacterized protein YodC (DUF2158 family)